MVGWFDIVYDVPMTSNRTIIVCVNVDLLLIKLELSLLKKADRFGIFTLFAILFPNRQGYLVRFHISLKSHNLTRINWM